MSSHESHFNTEYWVPTVLTKEQLKMYCDILRKNSNILCARKESSLRESLRDILTSTQQCAIHLEGLEQSIESSSTEAMRQNVEIAASGKLSLLSRMLEKINKKSLKALILYEEVSCSGRRIGDILEEFLLQKFGSDSYQRVKKDTVFAKRTTEFNENHKKFVFLIERRACLSVINLSSVSTILIFNNDWTPMDSLVALERIKYDPQPERIKIFRLFSPFTIEENILFFAREKKNIGSLKRMSWGNCHNLLMRGANNLFHPLSELSCDNTPVSSPSTISEKSLMEDIEQLFQRSEGTDTINLSVILKVQVEGSYHMSSQMPIELLGISQENYAEPRNYWNKLLKENHTSEVVSEKVIKKRKVDKGSSMPSEEVFQDECTPISTAAQLQVSSAGGIEHQLSSGGHTSHQLAQTPTHKTMSSHPDPCNNEQQIIHQNVEEEQKNLKEAVFQDECTPISTAAQLQVSSAGGIEEQKNLNEAVFQDECTPISTAAQLQVSSAGGIEHQLSSGGHAFHQFAQTLTRKAMSLHPDQCNNELQIICQKIEGELKNRNAALLVEFEKEFGKVWTKYVKKSQELHSEFKLKLNEACANSKAKLNEACANSKAVSSSTMLAETLSLRHGQVPSGKQQDLFPSNHVDLSCGQQQEVHLTASSSSAGPSNNSPA